MSRGRAILGLVLAALTFIGLIIYAIAAQEMQFYYIFIFYAISALVAELVWWNGLVLSIFSLFFGIGLIPFTIIRGLIATRFSVTSLLGLFLCIPAIGIMVALLAFAAIAAAAVSLISMPFHAVMHIRNTANLY